MSDSVRCMAARIHFLQSRRMAVRESGEPGFQGSKPIMVLENLA